MAKPPAKKRKPVRSIPLPYEFPGTNCYDKQEEAAALRVIRSKSPFRYYGPKCGFEVMHFETEFARVAGTRHALAVSSGTQALSTAMAALGIGPGAEVIVPAFQWIAIPASVLRLGAIPVFAEIDDSFTLDPDDVAGRITPRTRLIVAVHMSGAPADMRRLMAVARRHKLPVLEDCAQCNGGSFRGKPVGSIGTMGIFSLQVNKNMSTGEGGMVVTNRQGLIRRASALHDLGYPLAGGGPDMRDGPYALWGFGGRLSEIAGAIGRVQLRKLPRIVKTMRRANTAIRKGITGIDGLQVRRLNDEAGDTGAFLIVTLPTVAVAKRFAKGLNDENIRAGLSPTLRVSETGMHVYSNIDALVRKRSYSPDGFPWTLEANKQSVYDYAKGALPRSDDLMDRSLIMPVPSLMTGRDARDVVDGIRKVADRLL